MNNQPAGDSEVPFPPGVDTGAMLSAYFKKKRIYQSALGRAVGRGYSSVRDYKRRKSIQTSILWELCVALKHNFFADIAAMLPPEFTTDAPPDTAKDARIAELEAALRDAETARDAFERVLVGRAG